MVVGLLSQTQYLCGFQAVLRRFPGFISKPVFRHGFGVAGGVILGSRIVVPQLFHYFADL